MAKMLSPKNFDRLFCFHNFRKYLFETTLHGLRFIGDNNLKLLERLFFLGAFIGAVLATTNFITNIYVKWVGTPIIIGIDPYPTSISEIPFPALTLCNMNQLIYSQVANFSKNSTESAMVDIGCYVPLPFNENDTPEHFRNNNLSISAFLANHSQPCSRLIINCKFNSFEEQCMELFRETITDEGLCCVFNLLHPTFRYKYDFDLIKDYTSYHGAVPVPWNPETGYPENLPDQYYPRQGSGHGSSVGLSIIINAETDDAYCSSTNGPGFKLSLHSPLDVPRVREIGFSMATGKEARVFITPRSLYSTPLIRALPPASRLCHFSDEGDLKFYKFYTRRNCENECQSRYVYQICDCIPYNLPLVIANATICGAPQIHCAYAALKTWLTSITACREQCLPTCFDLTFTATSFSTPLVQGNYTVMDEAILKNMTSRYIRENIAIIHIFYQEFVFHGELRNVYIGFTDFLSSCGGILSLFLGFSFISLAEMFYYAILRPIFWWKRPLSARFLDSATRNRTTLPDDSFWLGNEIYRPKRDRYANLPVNKKNVLNNENCVKLVEFRSSKRN